MHILLFGDSLFVRREGAERPMIEVCLLEKLPALTISNRAISGLDSQGLLEQLSTLLPENPVNKVFILIGSNDLVTTSRILESDFADNVEQIINQLLQSYQPEQICLLSPPPVDENKQWYRHNGLVTSYTAVMEQIAEQRSCLFFNLYQLFMDKTKEVPLEILLEGSLDDGMHFGRLGYELLAEEIFRKIMSDFKT